MGFDYSYLLYFKRANLWNALGGVVAIAEPYEPPIDIHFPDHVFSIPLKSWTLKDKLVHHDDPRFGFDTILRFDVDDEIEEYLDFPADIDASNQVAIGHIYLDIICNLAVRQPNNEAADLVLFDFGTPGTRMSKLFLSSRSIRATFLDLLKQYDGVCGVFNQEDAGGEVFWLQGREVSYRVDDPYVLPVDTENGPDSTHADGPSP